MVMEFVTQLLNLTEDYDTMPEMHYSGLLIDSYIHVGAQLSNGFSNLSQSN